MKPAPIEKSQWELSIGAGFIQIGSILRILWANELSIRFFLIWWHAYYFWHAYDGGGPDHYGDTLFFWHAYDEGGPDHFMWHAYFYATAIKIWRLL